MDNFYKTIGFFVCKSIGQEFHLVKQKAGARTRVQ